MVATVTWRFKEFIRQVYGSIYEQAVTISSFLRHTIMSVTRNPKTSIYTIVSSTQGADDFNEGVALDYRRRFKFFGVTLISYSSACADFVNSAPVIVK